VGNTQRVPDPNAGIWTTPRKYLHTHTLDLTRLSKFEPQRIPTTLTLVIRNGGIRPWFDLAGIVLLGDSLQAKAFIKTNFVGTGLFTGEIMPLNIRPKCSEITSVSTLDFILRVLIDDI